MGRFLCILILFTHLNSHASVKDCRQTVKTLDNPKLTQTLQDEPKLIEAYRTLGVCYFELGDQEKSKTAFSQLLFIKPDYELNAFITPPKLLDLFNQIKSHINSKSQELIAAREKKIIYTKHSLFPAFVPFGVGQFENGNKIKGAIIASTEGVALAANIGFYWWKQSLNTNTIPNYSLVQSLQWVAIGTFLAIYAYGVIDALYYRQEMVLETNTDEFLKQLDQAKLQEP